MNEIQLNAGASARTNAEQRTPASASASTFPAASAGVTRPAGRQRMRGIALIVLGTSITATLVAAVGAVVPSGASANAREDALLLGLFMAGILAGLAFTAAGAQLLLRGHVGKVTRAGAAIVLVALLALLCQTRWWVLG